MEETRKTDRRTLYTRMVIKDALLELLEKKEYADITVADICRSAEINRGTFYLHYNNINKVIEDLMDDALNNIHSVLLQVGCGISAGEKCGYPFCLFLRENKKYQSLFFADSLRSYVLEKMADVTKGRLTEKFRQAAGCSEDVMQALYYFQLNGCLAVCKRYADVSDKKWTEIQCSIDQFLRVGFENL